MRIDLDSMRRHYASLPDGELLALDRDDLTEAGQTVYDEEIARRGLNEAEEGEAEFAEDGGGAAEFGELDELIDQEGPEPEWLEDGAVACAFVAYPGSPAAERASLARAALQASGIPSYITVTQDQSDENQPERDVLNVTVPGALALHATSILDRDMFNEEHEGEWRTHLDAMSDQDIQSLDPRIFCAGLLDRVARMKKAYAEEMAKRKLRARE